MIRKNQLYHYAYLQEIYVYFSILLPSFLPSMFILIRFKIKFIYNRLTNFAFFFLIHKVGFKFHLKIFC